MSLPCKITYLFLLFFASAESQSSVPIRFDFYGDTIQLKMDATVDIGYDSTLEENAIQQFAKKLESSYYSPLIDSLKVYKTRLKLDDWLYYQLIRKTAQHISPKKANYYRYTLYKWFLLSHSGYDALLTIAGNQLLFYVQSDENIYNIPYRYIQDKQYVCLNYHDYGSIDFEKTVFQKVLQSSPAERKGFSYKVASLPNFRPDDYLEKDIRFNYNNNNYYFRIKINPEIRTIFANYPVVDYESQFNIPLSTTTYQSLIPLLKKTVKSMNIRNGVDFLMLFTRHAFVFETDTRVFGIEKRLTPEQTLLYEQSDCEDRAALFFYLVKEIYDLPMIVLNYPHHVTVAVKLDKPIGTPVIYNGKAYTVCEPTTQKEDIPMGQLLPELKNQSYEIAYAYPGKD